MLKITEQVRDEIVKAVINSPMQAQIAFQIVEILNKLEAVEEKVEKKS